MGGGGGIYQDEEEKMCDRVEDVRWSRVRDKDEGEWWGRRGVERGGGEVGKRWRGVGER